MSRSVQLLYLAYVTTYLQTDLFLAYLFFRERKTVSVQLRNDVNHFFVIGLGTPRGVSFQGNSI